MLGEAIVPMVDKPLDIDFNNFLFYKTEHWHYITFVRNLDLKSLKRIFINFNLMMPVK